MVNFELITLGGVKFSGDVYEVILPTTSGYIGVLPGHMPLVSLATKGIISVRSKETDSDDMMTVFATNGGVLEVSNNNLKLLVDEADNAEDISEQEAQKAYDQAQDLLKSSKDPLTLQNAQSLIDMSATRIKVAQLKRRTHKRRQI